MDEKTEYEQWQKKKYVENSNRVRGSYINLITALIDGVNIILKEPTRRNKMEKDLMLFRVERIKEYLDEAKNTFFAPGIHSEELNHLFMEYNLLKSKVNGLLKK